MLFCQTNGRIARKMSVGWAPHGSCRDKPRSQASFAWQEAKSGQRKHGKWIRCFTQSTKAHSRYSLSDFFDCFYTILRLPCTVRMQLPGTSFIFKGTKSRSIADHLLSKSSRKHKTLLPHQSSKSTLNRGNLRGALGYLTRSVQLAITWPEQHKHFAEVKTPSTAKPQDVAFK